MKDFRGRRYGEVLLVGVGTDSGGSASEPHATVYNTFGLNDCPAELWSQLDAEALARDHGAAAALLNGPRYWLMDSIEKAPSDQREIATFGGIDMFRTATVKLTSMNPAPYRPNIVTRNTVFVFDSGETVFELVDPSGRHWVMQTWSQVVDPTLAYEDLAALGTRLNLPDGWSYRARVLDEDLRIDTLTEPAQVLQDDLTNSYSLVTEPV
ncbi:MAG: hypothetical protein K0U78_12285 [Actinomycetia bacterium]|nr:hypothetical protein [Actinomycetes bacterium]